MDALPNATVRRGGSNPQSAGFAPNAYPEAVNGSKTGESVGYEHEPNKRWIVLRATHNRAIQAYKLLKQDGIEAYLPMKTMLKVFRGKRIKTLEPLLPNLLFVHADLILLDEYLRTHPKISYLNYYYNHFKTLADGKNPPLIIGDEEMVNFINLTSVDNQHIRLVKPDQCHFKSGDKVRVIYGQFKGVQGMVARVGGQQRVVVIIDGLCSIATAYIPTDFLEYI